MTQEPGEPQRLRAVGFWESLVRGRFEIDCDGSHFVVDSLYFDFEERIRLYQNGKLVDTVRRRASWDIGGGRRIEAAVSQVGMKYVRVRTGRSHKAESLRPSPGTPEAWRSRIDREHPTASRLTGVAAIIILIGVLLIELPQLINLIEPWTNFRAPTLDLPIWANIALIVLACAAAAERSVSMKHNALLDD